MKISMLVCAVAALLFFNVQAEEKKAERKVANQEPVEVQHLIKCEDGDEPQADLNRAFIRGEVYGNDGNNMIVVKKPFTVSAPAVLIRAGRTPRLCVTVSSLIIK
jgi:hypothetical protein